jgi:hypothetical protein
MSMAKIPPRGRNRLLAFSDALATSPQARRFAREHNMPALLATSVAVLALEGTGVAHLLQEPENPAVYLVMFLFSTPLLFLTYWETHGRQLPPAQRLSRSGFMLGALALSVFALSTSLAEPQVLASGLLTLLIWTLFDAIIWSLALVCADLAYAGALRRWLLHHLTQGIHRRGG